MIHNRMSPKIGIVVFSGLPAAGKTTLARKLMLFCETEAVVLITVSCKQKQTLSQPVADCVSEIEFIHICYDDIMTAQLHESSSEENAWKTFRKYIRLCVELEITKLLEKGLLLEESKEAVLTVNDHLEKEPSVMESSNRDTTGMYSHHSQIPEDILMAYTKSKKMKRGICDEGDKLFVFLIDDNMFLRSMRYEYYQMARKYGTGFCQVSIRCSVDEAQQQNSKRTQHRSQSTAVSQSTIVNMASKFEVPNIQNRWEEFSIFLDRENCCNSKQMCEVWQLIVESIYQPVDKREEIDEETRTLDRLICSQNVLHQVDQILRREIGRQLKIMQSEKIFKKEDLRKQADFLNGKKSSVLESMRTGKIGLPRYLEKHVKDACKDGENPFYIYIKEVFEA